jgi:hypothetical protein
VHVTVIAEIWGKGELKMPRNGLPGRLASLELLSCARCQVNIFNASAARQFRHYATLIVTTYIEQDVDSPFDRLPGHGPGLCLSNPRNW